MIYALALVALLGVAGIIYIGTLSDEHGHEWKFNPFLDGIEEDRDGP